MTGKRVIGFRTSTYFSYVPPILKDACRTEPCRPQHTAEFKIKKAERWNGEFEIGGKAVPVPREVDVAFHKVKEAMSELQYHLFMDLYPIDCYHIKEASP